MKTKILQRQCPVCLNKYGTVLERIQMVLPDQVQIPGEYDVVYCNECGFTFADVDASQGMYDKYYETCNDYSCSAALKSGVTDSMNHFRYQLLSRYVDKNAKILDVGCGSGRLLKLLKDNGYHNLYGMDPSKDSIKKLKEQGIQGEIKNIFGEAGDTYRHVFDVVMSTAVIEHIYDLNRFIQQLLCYLVPDKGMLFIDAPAVEGFEKFYTPRANYFNQEHINYFSLVSIDNIFAKYGYIRKNHDDESFVVLGGEQPEMAITAIYKSSSEKKERKKDTAAKRSVQCYFEQEHAREKAVYDKIQEFLKQGGKQVMIWGTGAYTMQLLQKMPELKNQVVCFIDNNAMKAGRKLLGKEIFTPEVLMKNEMPYPILICSMLNAHDIEEQIEGMGIHNHYLAIN